MTPRSPKQHQAPSKTTTISRKLRNRADQNISIQPPELAHLRGLRTQRRAVTLPSVRRTSVNYPSEDTQTPAWDPTLLDAYTRSTTSHPTGLVQNLHSGLLSQPLDLATFHPHRTEPPTLATTSTAQDYEVLPASDSELLPSPLPSLSGSHTATEFDLRLSVEPEPPHNSSLELQDMSTLGFMMAPAQYGMDHYGSPPSLDSPSYPPMSQSYTEPKHPTSSSYAPTYIASPSLQSQSQPRRSTEQSPLSPYQAPPMPRSPYQQPMGPMRTSPSPMSYPPASSEPPQLLSSAPMSYAYPAVHTNLPAQTLGSNTSGYPPPALYPPSSYAVSEYAPLPTTLYPVSPSPAPYPSYDTSPGIAPPGAGAVPGGQSNGVMPRVLNSRPKPQCWEHGCNGRQFSTFSNLLRHQREKSGTAAKSYCPRCGAEFTRTTARNGHMAHEKCKPRRASDTNR